MRSVEEIQKEISSQLDKIITEMTITTATQWQSVFPTMTVVSPTTVAAELISVQPLSMPANLFTYIDFKRQSLYKVFYVNNSGSDSVMDVEALDIEDAVQKIEDFGHLKYYIEE